MNKDDLLLSEAYAQVVNETIGDRLKGMGAGIGAGLRQGVQNVAGKIAGATGANVQTSGNTAGGAYANAQQTSLVNSFIKKAQKEIADFNNDVSKMGVNPNDEQFPEIKKQLDSVNNLIKFLQNPQGPAPAPAPAGGTTPTAAPDGGTTPTAATASSTATGIPNANETEDQGQTGNFNANLVGQTPTVQKPKTIATQQQSTGTVQGIPHGIQRNPNTNTNTSFSMANPQPVTKQVNELPKQEPVQKAMPEQPEQEAELVGGEEKPQTQGYANLMGQQDGKKPEAPKSTTPEGQSVQASQSDLNNGSGAVEKKPYTKKADGWYIGTTKVGDAKATILDKLWQKQNKSTQQSSPQQNGGLKTAAQIGAQGGNKTKVNEAFRFWRRF